MNMQNSSEDSTQSDTSALEAVLQVVNELARKSANGNYIYRGEPECYDKISSSLYRDIPFAVPQGFNIDALQEAHLDEARKFTFETDDLAILTELQHYGGKTNLIDFTADYLIALFFACDGSYLCDGRVVLLARGGEMSNHIHGPRNPVNRVIAQKSVFVQPPLGYIEVEDNDIVIIPNNLKHFTLDYLHKSHGISQQTVYNDLHGFVRYKETHRDVLNHSIVSIVNLLNGDCQSAIDSCTESLNLDPFAPTYIIRGFAYFLIGDYERAIDDFNRAIVLDPNYAAAYGGRGFSYALTGDYERAIDDFNRAIALNTEDAAAYSGRGLVYAYLDDYYHAIDDFDQAIVLNPDNSSYYCNRGEAWLHLSEWDNAKADLATAQDMGVDIVESFRSDYESVADFERHNNITLPDDIAAMLGG